MLIEKDLSFRGLMKFSGHHLIWLTAWMTFVAVLYYFTRWKWLSIPWLPVSLIGTAVAFYVGFKSNQSYDRLWEGRKIWGAIVNGSRIWASLVRSFIQNENGQNAISEAELLAVKKQLIYRHLGWIYTLRHQLLLPVSWEHMSLKIIGIGSYNVQRSKTMGIGLYADETYEKFQQKYIPAEEYERIKTKANPAAHLIDTQSQKLAELKNQSLIDSFKLADMQRLLNDFYDQQGRAERIKRTPFPRQYANLSFIFVCIFIFLLPLGIVGEFAKIGDAGIGLSIPFGIIVGWVFVNMELVGDYSENPFEGLFNDVPMLTICRNIEIDLLQMLDETDVPPAIQAKNGVLM
ncbi:hypothetical protein IC229_09410 [Spirosoma sp. BT702]|uniref:Multidrug transporter n=1 Tax=Spirosoma profusum TaxID=2771354 RepID=A0A926XVT5_9BACT|nr:bestrophin family ion channel [Spirosoma profusum]MBD2700855.1 hypothetical protein [Spirosoma profusum]